MDLHVLMGRVIIRWQALRQQKHVPDLEECAVDLGAVGKDDLVVLLWASRTRHLASAQSDWQGGHFVSTCPQALQVQMQDRVIKACVFAALAASVPAAILSLRQVGGT